MKLKLVYERAIGGPVDITVTVDPTASVGEVADGIARVDPGLQNAATTGFTLSVSPPGGYSDSTVLDARRPIGEAAIASGYGVRLTSVGAASGIDQGGVTSVIVRVVSGPDAGREFAVPEGSHIIGRESRAGIILTDPMVSKRHARLDISDAIDLVDLNSANGILVDGGLVSRLTLVPDQLVTLGDSVIVVTRPGGARVGRVEVKITNGGVPFNRSPKVEQRYPEQQHPRPAVPTEPEPPTFAWLMLVAPLVMGAAMYLITDRVMSLLFVLMAPLMMIGNYLTGRRKNKRQLKSELAKFDAQLARLDQRLAHETQVEAAARRAEVPSVAEILENASTTKTHVWTRRPEHWSFLAVRLGTATLPSRNRIAPPPELDDSIPQLSERVSELEERHRFVSQVPLIELARLAGAIGVAGPAGVDVARGLMVHLTGLHSPAELVVVGFTSLTSRPDWEWLRWLPHTSSPQSPVDTVHLADTQPSATALLAALEAVVAERLERRLANPSEEHGPLGDDLSGSVLPGRLGATELESAPPLPAIVVLVAGDAPVDRSRLLQLANRATAAGILPIWLADSADMLPAVCRTFLDVGADHGAVHAHFVRHGRSVSAVDVETVDRASAERFARALAPLVDSSAITLDATDLPASVSMLTLLGKDMAESSAAVVERWQQNLSLNSRDGVPTPRARAGTLRALVGQQGADAMHLDLRTQGPHALVGGTTGSGKSEFLQAWVLGMAAEYSPDRVTFLFVDYKGGAAFAECVRLPHCVGLVTDLSPHLVRRALTSLRAELHHREHLLNRKKAKDLLELERRGDPEAPPALVLVIDEFAALSNDVPEFVEGVVDIAQRGRSLGIHLIMATQRPAGVIKDNLRANTNLRIALRMADETDSTDVIGTSVAAHFDPMIPGRAVAKSGPGRLTSFQSAYAGGHTLEESPEAEVVVQTLRFGTPEIWQRPLELQEAPPEDPGPTDQVRLVESIIAAAGRAEVPAPRKPWLEELRSVYDLARFGPWTDTELILGIADLPEQQAQSVVRFNPDVDGNLAVYGTGGAGKSVLLRTLAIGAGITPRGGPVHVYGLDFSTGGLRILEPLPHVGAIVAGDDHERVTRLLRTLGDLADERARLFPRFNACSIVEYRDLAGLPDEPRILLLVDNFPAFRDAYDVGGLRQETYTTLLQLLSEGRALGIHVVFTADRPASVPGSVTSSVPRRVVMRLADETGYMILGVPNDILAADSPPGRSVIDGLESQIVIFGGSGNVADQSKAINDLAKALHGRRVTPAPPIEALPAEIEISSLPVQVDGFPVLGLSDETLAPIGFEPQGTFLVGGGPGSGRTNALVALAQSLRRWDPDVTLVYFGIRRSAVPNLVPWDVVATSLEDVATTAKQLSEAFAGPLRQQRTAVFIEGVADFAQTPADASVVDLIRAIKRSEHLVVGEAETSSWGSVFPIFAEIRNSRRGILLQPESVEGDQIMRTSFPRVKRSEFPAGRGMAVLQGRAVKVQLPLADRGVLPIPRHQPAA